MMVRGVVVQVACVALAGAGLLLPIPSALVERWYAGGLYPVVQRTVTPIANLVPLAVFDLLILLGAVYVLAVIGGGARRAWRTRRVSPAAGAVWRVLVSAAAVYLMFLGLWGLNYRRVPLADRLDLRPGVPTSEAVVDLGLEAVSRLNAIHAEAHAAGWAEPPWRSEPLREGFAELQGLLGDGAPAVPGRLKSTVLGPYFRWTGVDGMINPFALESLANPDLLPFERPFVAAHEWAHLAGYADEAEASFVGWLACLRGDAATEYSGWLYLFVQVRAEAGEPGRTALYAVLDDGPRSDLAAIAERRARGQVPVLRRASWSVYDRYLRANRVEEGVRRYSAVVTLAAQAQFADGWTPVRRSSGG